MKSELRVTMRGAMAEPVLVTAKLLRSPSKWYQTDSTGAVTPIKGNPGKCT